MLQELLIPQRKVWRGSHEDRAESQGIIVLGTPVGHQEFVKQELLKTVAEHSKLLLKIPEVKDLQCAWLLLLYCGVARANFYLRTVRPELTEEFSQMHDEQIWRCFLHHRRSCARGTISQFESSDVPCHSQQRSGVEECDRLRHVAHWASWADTIKVHERHPEVAESILEAVEGHNQAPTSLLSKQRGEFWWPQGSPLQVVAVHTGSSSSCG